VRAGSDRTRGDFGDGGSAVRRIERATPPIYHDLRSRLDATIDPPNERKQLAVGPTALARTLLQIGGDITTALDDVGLPAALIDRDGMIRWQNGAAVLLRGRHVGDHFADLVVPEEQPDVRERIARILSHGEPAEFTVRVPCPDGEPVSIQLSAAPVRDGVTVIGIFGLGYVIDQAATAPIGTDLTPRQLEVLHLLGEGRSTDEIAAHLSLKPTTVRNHVANLLTALGVHSRLQAVVAASKAGLLDSDRVG
jgi:DNA-binding CsgD family transcriptional regulator